MSDGPQDAALHSQTRGNSTQRCQTTRFRSSNCLDDVAARGDATAANPYLIWIGPGTYTGPIDVIPHVHLRGAGQSATIVTANRGAAAHPSMIGTVTMVSDTSLRDLTVHSSAATGVTTGVLVDGAATDAAISNVRIRVDGAAGASRGIVVRHRSTVDVRDVDIRIENASSSNRAIEVSASQTQC